MYIKFQKIQKQKKNLALVEYKLVKLNKIEKTEEAIAQYQEVECLWYLLYPSYKTEAYGKQPEQTQAK